MKTHQKVRSVKFERPKAVMMNVSKIKNSVRIRQATIEDLSQLVNIHVTSWNATYPTYEPKPNRGLREKQWKNAFEKREQSWFCYVVEIADGEIAGFATGHLFYDPELPYKGQLDKIHFRKAYQRLGLGSILVRQVVRHFLSQQLHSMILFADPANPNIVFYDVLSGERLPDKDGTFQGAVGWKNLDEFENRLANNSNSDSRKV